MIGVCMIALALVPLLVGLVLRHVGAQLVHALPPTVATALLTVLALTVALTGGLVLSILAVVSLAQLPLAGRLGGWSAAVVRSAGGPPTAVGVGCALVVIVLLSTSARQGLRIIVAALHARSTLARSAGSTRPTTSPDGGYAGGVLVVDDPLPDAYALAGLLGPGRIVVSTGMLQALSADQRRILFAHERAHLSRRHHAFVALTDLAAAANPLLRPLRPAVRSAVERWADEVAATAIGDRRAVAEALATAARARTAGLLAATSLDGPAPRSRRHAMPGGGADRVTALAAAEGDVVTRVRALLAPRTATGRRLPTAVVSAALACWCASGALALHLENVMELAKHLSPG